MSHDLEKAARRARAADLVARAYDRHRPLAKWGDEGFDESKVNRDEDGQFAPKAGGSAKPSKAEAAAAKEAFLADFRESRGKGYDTLAERTKPDAAAGSKKGGPKGVNWKKMSQQKASKPPRKAKDVVQIPKDPYRKKREMVIGGEMRPEGAKSQEMVLGRRAYAWKAKIFEGDDVEIFKPDFSGRVNALVTGFDKDGNLLVRRRFSANRPSNRAVKVSPKNVTRHIPLKETGRRATLTAGDNVSYSLPRNKKPVNGRVIGFTSDGQVKVRRAAARSASGAYTDETIHPRDIKGVFAVKFAMFDDLMKWGGDFDESKVKRDEDGKFSEKRGSGKSGGGKVDETYRGKVEEEAGMFGANMASGAVAEGGSRALRSLKQGGSFASRFVPGGWMGRGAVMTVPTLAADVAGRVGGESAGRAVDVSIFGDQKAAEAQRIRETKPISQQKVPQMGWGETAGFLAGNIGGSMAGAKAGAAVGSIFAPGAGTVVGGLIGAGLGGYLGESGGTKAGRAFDRRQRAEKMVAAIYDLHKSESAPKGGDMVHVPSYTRSTPGGGTTKVDAYSYPKGGRAGGSTSTALVPVKPEPTPSVKQDKRLSRLLRVGRTFLREQAASATAKAVEVAKDRKVRERVITVIAEGADVVEALTGTFDMNSSQQIGEAVDAAFTVAEIYLEQHRDKLEQVSRKAKRVARRVVMRKAAGLSDQQQAMYDRLVELGEEDPEAAELFVAMMTLLSREELTRMFELDGKRRRDGITEEEEVEMATIMARLHDRYNAAD